MSENELINSKNNDIQSMDYHVLPDTLTADEWQTFVFSGFLNEYKKDEINNQINELKTKINTLESLDYSFNGEKKTFIDYISTYIKILFVCMFSIVKIFILCFVIGLVLELLFKNSLGKIFDDIFGYVVFYCSMPLRKLFNIFPNATSANDYAIIQVLLSCVSISIVYSIYVSIKIFTKANKDYENNKQESERLEKERKEELEKTKKELDEYLPEAKIGLEECENNLKEIYDQNLIPDMYHDTYSMGMLYGYFASKAATTFQDAAREYLQDQRTNQLVERMQNISDVLVEIAKQKSELNRALGISNDKLDKLIEQNDRSIIGKLFPNNPVSKIYNKTLKTIKNTR